MKSEKSFEHKHHKVLLKNTKVPKSYHAVYIRNKTSITVKARENVYGSALVLIGIFGIIEASFRSVVVITFA